eukprot:765281-Hanusia_phi.AAC.2
MEVNLNDQSDSAEDEDYDPLKDPSAVDDEDDEESDSFEGLRHVLDNSKRSKNVAKRVIPSDSSPDLISRRTRTRLRLPDELWTEADMQLDMAEKALDPLSPSSEKEDLSVCLCKISVSQHELNALLEEDSAMAAATDHGVAGEAGLSNDRSKRKQKRGLKERTSNPREEKTEMDFFSKSAFSREQFVQLQCQMRVYFQLATQQYVLNCCDTENRRSNADIIKNLYDGLAEFYRVWEVTTEFGKLQDKAVQHLIEYTIGATSSYGFLF